MGGKGDRPTLENRWWVDQQTDSKGYPIDRPPATHGRRFFHTGDGFDQDRAQRRLTDLNLKWFNEIDAPTGEWALLPLLEKDRFPPKRLEKVKSAFSVPAEGQGILVDSGTAVRAIITGRPLGERLVEVRLGAESSFDAWVHGEWVREVLFRGFDDALRRGPRLVREYLTTTRGARSSRDPGPRPLFTRSVEVGYAPPARRVGPSSFQRQGVPVATTDDEAAKKRVQEAIWQGVARGTVLAVTFGFGMFAGWVMWGSGEEGAPALRTLKVEQDAQILELKNKRVDIEGRLEVASGKLSTCTRDLQKVRTELATLKVAAQEAAGN